MDEADRGDTAKELLARSELLQRRSEELIAASVAMRAAAEALIAQAKSRLDQ
jgi:hypothetical protein